MSALPPKADMDRDRQPPTLSVERDMGGANEKAGRTYSLPVASLYGFITGLQNLQSGKRPVETSAAVSAAVAQPAPAKDLNRINITVPKNWAMRSGLPDHPFVIMVFNPQTEAQAGFALSAASAREFAAGLTKYADELAHHETAKPKSN
jgi:hypothetical protein